MIIGKNTNFQPNQNQFGSTKVPKQNPLSNMNPIVESNRAMQHTDVMSKTEMDNKAFAILEDRLNKGLITMEEFNKKCTQLGKRK